MMYTSQVYDKQLRIDIWDLDGEICNQIAIGSYQYGMDINLLTVTMNTIAYSYVGTWGMAKGITLYLPFIYRGRNVRIFTSKWNNEKALL